MGRTIRDVFVADRALQEVNDEVRVWMLEEGIDVVEQRDDFVRARLGIPGGLGLTAPKYYEISYKVDENGVLVHTEGWIGVYGVSESSFSKTAFLGGIPRRKGWKTFEKLWSRLESLSKLPPPPPSTLNLEIKEYGTDFKVKSFTEIILLNFVLIKKWISYPEK